MRPRRASLPTTPTGAGRRSSSSTVVSAFTEKRGASWTVAPADVIDWPWPPDSDDPYPSTTRLAGIFSAYRHFTDGGQVAPPDWNTLHHYMQYACASLSTASTH